MVFPRIQPNPECREGFYNASVAGPNTELTIQENIPDAGLVRGDRIVAAGTSNISNLTRPRWDEIWSAASEIHLTVVRGENRIEVPVPVRFKAQVESSVGQTSFFQCRDSSGNIFNVNVYGENNSAFVRVNQDEWSNVNVDPNYPIRLGFFGASPSLHQDLPVSEAQIPLSRGFFARATGYAGYSAITPHVGLTPASILGAGVLVGYRWSQNATYRDMLLNHRNTFPYGYTEGSVGLRGVVESFDLNANREYISLDLETNRTFLISNNLRFYWHVNPIGMVFGAFNLSYSAIFERGREGSGILVGLLAGVGAGASAFGFGPGANLQFGVRLNNFSQPDFYFQSSIAQIGIEIYQRVRVQVDASMRLIVYGKENDPSSYEYPIRISIIGGL